MLLLSQRTFQRPRNDSSTPTSDQHHSSFSGALPRSQCQEEEVNCFRFPSFPDMVQSASKTPENDQLTVCLWRSRLEGPFSAVSTKKKSKTHTHTPPSRIRPEKGARSHTSTQLGAVPRIITCSIFQVVVIFSRATPSLTSGFKITQLEEIFLFVNSNL